MMRVGGTPKIQKHKNVYVYVYVYTCVICVRVCEIPAAHFPYQLWPEK